MRPVLLIAAKDLRQRLRDRSAIVIGVIAPLVIAGLMAVAFKGSESFHFKLAVVDADHGAAANGLIQALQDPAVKRVLTVVPMSTTAAATSAVRANKAQAGLVIPAGFSASVGSAQPVALTTLTNVNTVTAGNVVSSIATSFVAQLNADRLSVATAQAAGAPAGPELQAAAARLTIPERVLQRPVGARELKPISYFSPAMAIFFLLFIIGYTARSFFVDQGEGMIERMRAAPVRPLQIMAGKALSVFAFGVTSLTTVALVTSAGFGAYWGDPLAAGAVGLAMVISVVCLTALVIGLARSRRQAEGISSMIVFGLALLGGNFVFLSQAPTLLRRVSLLTPNGWAMRAYTDLSTNGGGLHAVLLPVAAMLGFSVVFGVAAALLAPRAVTT